MAKHVEIRQTVGSMEAMRQSRCIREAAAMLVLARTGTEFDTDIVEGVWEKVGRVAAEFCASPDDIQQVLEMHEPTLAIGAAQ